MEYRRFGSTELRVSQIAFGGATFGREIDAPTAWRLLDRALERGINLLDTAEAYSNRESERIIGRWLADRKNRQEIVLATKCYGKLNGDIIAEKIEQSLQCLQTDWIDLFQIHHFPHDGDPLDEILESLDRAVQAGKVRHLGLSNCAAWQFCKALWQQDRSGWARFESMQPSYSLVERSIESEMMPLCKDQDVAIISYAPIASGFLAGKYSKGGPIPAGTRFDVAPGHQDVFFSNRNFACVDRIKAIAAEAGRSLVDLALAWTFFHPDITCVLIGGRKISHVDQAFETLERGLDPELRERLDQASQPNTFG